MELSFSLAFMVLLWSDGILNLGVSQHSGLRSILLYLYWGSVVKLERMGFHEGVTRKEVVLKSITSCNSFGGDVISYK